MDKKSIYIGIGWSVFMALIFGLISQSILLGFLVGAGYLLYFFVLSPMTDKRNKLQLQKAYQKFQDQMPDASKPEIENAVRKYLFRRKMLTPFLLFLTAIICIFLLPLIMGPIAESSIKNSFISLTRLIGLISEIASVLFFAAALHDPITPAEAEELSKRETAEKGGN